jgi:GDP-L-fucose synthase
MPTNLYGPGDNFDLATSHVLPALIRRFSEAVENGSSEVVLWGTGLPRREFLHVDDLANAVLLCMERYDDDQILNVGVGSDVTIKELAEIIASVTGFQGEILWDSSKPDGTPRKVLDVSRIVELGWSPKITLKDGIIQTLAWYRENLKRG